MTGIELAGAAGYGCVLDGRPKDPNADLRPGRRAGKEILHWHRDGRGALVELWRRSWEEDGNIAHALLDGFTAHDKHAVEQVYVSETRPGVIKGWHLHPTTPKQTQTDRFVCIRGTVLVATFDLISWADLLLQYAERRKAEPSYAVGREEYIFGLRHHIHERVLSSSSLERIDIPPDTAHGWINIGTEDAWVLNLTSAEYTGELEWRRDPYEGPAPGVMYDWRRPRDG